MEFRNLVHCLKNTFFFVFQLSGNRLYFNKTLEIDLNVINRLKQMNSSFPENSSDYDEKFVYFLTVAVLNMTEMKDFLKDNKLRNINHDKRLFIKSKIYIAEFIFWKFSIILHFIGDRCLHGTS